MEEERKGAAGGRQESIDQSLGTRVVERKRERDKKKQRKMGDEQGPLKKESSECALEVLKLRAYPVKTATTGKNRCLNTNNIDSNLFQGVIISHSYVFHLFV